VEWLVWARVSVFAGVFDLPAWADSSGRRNIVAAVAGSVRVADRVAVRGCRPASWLAADR
jgi:hypothetical protein